MRLLHLAVHTGEGTRTVSVVHNQVGTRESREHARWVDAAWLGPSGAFEKLRGCPFRAMRSGKRPTDRTLPLGGVRLLLGCLVVGGAALAQQPPGIEDLQTLRANPLSGLRTVTLQYQANVGTPALGDVQSVWTLQAVWPFPLGEHWSLITYPSLSVMSQLAPTSGDDRVAGLGDTIVTAVVTPTETGRLIWGTGAVLEIPTATNRDLGTSRWAAGPALALFVQPNPLTVGVLLENAWSFTGGTDGEVNAFEAQYFFTWNLPHGWFLQSNGTVTANWKAEPMDRWTVPVGRLR